MMFGLATKASFSLSSLLASSLLLSMSLQTTQAIPIPVRSRDVSLKGTGSDINAREPGPDVHVSVDFGGDAGFGVNVTVWNTTITSAPPLPPANVAPPSPQSSSESSPTATDVPSLDGLGNDGADDSGDTSSTNGTLTDSGSKGTDGGSTDASGDAAESRGQVEPSAPHKNVARQDDSGDNSDAGGGGDAGDGGIEGDGSDASENGDAGSAVSTDGFSDDGEPQPKDAIVTLGRLVHNYQLLRAATFAAPEGSALMDNLKQEIERIKQTLFEKFGQEAPEGTTAPSGTPNPSSTVNAPDGTLVTAYPMGSSVVVISSNGQNQTLSLGPDGQFKTMAATASSSYTLTSTYTVLSTSTFTPSATASAAQANASYKNAAASTRPIGFFPTSMGMRCLSSVVGGLLFGAWVAL